MGISRTHFSPSSSSVIDYPFPNSSPHQSHPLPSLPPHLNRNFCLSLTLSTNHPHLPLFHFLPEPGASPPSPRLAHSLRLNEITSIFFSALWLDGHHQQHPPFDHLNCSTPSSAFRCSCSSLCLANFCCCNRRLGSSLCGLILARKRSSDCHCLAGKRGTLLPRPSFQTEELEQFPWPGETEGGAALLYGWSTSLQQASWRKETLLLLVFSSGRSCNLIMFCVKLLDFRLFLSLIMCC